MKKIGFVGLGRMGAPMVRQLAKAGFDVLAIDHCDAARQSVENLKQVQTSDDLSQLADVSIVITMLPNGKVVQTVVKAISNVLNSGALIVDMSSANPEDYDALQSVLHESNIRLIGAPVSGNVSGAQSGTLSIIAGGQVEDVEEARPLFDAMGKALFHMGPLGSGQVMKALNNLLSATGLIAAIEVLLVAKKAGLDPAQVVEVLNVSTGRNNSTERKIAPFVLSRRFDSGFNLSLMVKDLVNAAAIADSLDLKLPLTSHAISLSKEAVKVLGDGHDHTAIAKWLEGEVGSSFV